MCAGLCPGLSPSAYISLALIECITPAKDNAKHLTCTHNNPMRSVVLSYFANEETEAQGYTTVK